MLFIEPPGFELLDYIFPDRIAVLHRTEPVDGFHNVFDILNVQSASLEYRMVCSRISIRCAGRNQVKY